MNNPQIVFSPYKKLFSYFKNLSVKILCCFSLLCNSSFGQTTHQLSKLTPKWKLGDEKVASNITSTKIFYKDSLINSTQAISKYRIKVIDTVKNYTIQFANLPNTMEIETKIANPALDSTTRFITNIIKKLEKNISAFPYEFYVNKSTGQAIEVKNADKFLQHIQELTTIIFIQLNDSMQELKIPIDSLKQIVSNQIKNAEPKILETMINEFNYLMQPYSYEFKLNSSISQKTMIHDVNALGEFGDVEMPAILTISSKKQDNILTISTNTDYDKNVLLEEIKKKYQNMNHITISDIVLTEKVEAQFSIKNSWIIAHKSNIVFKTKEVHLINETIVKFE